VPGIVDIRLTGDASRFVMVGRARGQTTLLLLMTDGSERHYTITVGSQQELPPPTNDPLKVTPQASVRLDLYFVQVDRKRSMNVGMTVPSRIGFANIAYSYNIPAAALVAKSAVVGTEFLPTLDMAQSQGWAKVARHIAVITANGQPARFDSGGEFNAATTGPLGAPVLFTLRFGTELSIQPRYDKESGRIELTVSAEISDLSATGADIPGRSRSRVETVSNLALGESLAVAGLAAHNQERSRGGIPYLSQIPILGLLFGSQADKEQDVENVVFIAPSVVEPMKHPRGKEFLGRAMRTFEEYKGKKDGAHVFPGAPFASPASSGPDR